MIMRLISYFKGYVKIHARGYFLERFLNLCLMEDILLWELNRPSPSELYAKVSIKAFKELRKSARKTRTKIEIEERYGLPFFLQKHRKRRGFAIGLIIFIIIIQYFSTHLMGITLDGNNAISDAKLLNALSSYGVKIGTPLDDIDSKILKNQLMTSLDELGWIGVNLKGSRLHLKITEREGREDIPGTDEPCNLVASKDGVVRLMEIRDGQTMVLVDTLVKEGDLLVSGVIDSKAVGMRYTHSYGEVFATTWYKEEIKIPLSYKAKVMTDNKKSKIRLNFLGFSLPLYINEKPDYKQYTSHKAYDEYALPLKIFPSLIIEKEEFFQKKEQNRTRSVSEAVTLGKFQLLNQLNGKLSDGAEIIDLKISHEESGDFVTVTLECECLENIAVKTPIDKTEDLEYNNDN